jgi:hypothetical protein
LPTQAVSEDSAGATPEQSEEHDGILFATSRGFVDHENNLVPFIPDGNYWLYVARLAGRLPFPGTWAAFPGCTLRVLDIWSNSFDSVISNASVKGTARELRVMPLPRSP